MKTKQHKKIVIGLLLFSLIAMYGFLPPLPMANAVDSIMNAQDLISDSDVNATNVTHTFTFETGTTTPLNGYWEIDFDPSGAPSYPNGFTGIATSSVTCGYGDANLTEQVRDTYKVRCLANATSEAATSTQVVVTSVTNGSAATKYIDITNRNASGVILETVRVAVAVIQDILMTASVNSTLTFAISGTTTAASVNSIPCSNTSTATTTPFGTLTTDATSTVCQQLNVTTNADDGYTVTVEQDQEMTSDSDSNINSFNNSPDGTGTTTAEAWAVPTNTLDSDHTYGHMGLTSDDTDLSSSGGYNEFYNGGTAHFAGLSTTTPMEVMHHSGPSDGSTQDKGKAMVLYQVEVASLQEAGDYENTLTYICTPTY